MHISEKQHFVKGGELGFPDRSRLRAAKNFDDLPGIRPGRRIARHGWSFRNRGDLGLGQLGQRGHGLTPTGFYPIATLWCMLGRYCMSYIVPVTTARFLPQRRTK